MTHRALPILALVLFAGPLRADGPADNLPDKVRRVPPPGIVVPNDEREALAAGVAALGKEIDDLRTALKEKPALLDLLPDVQIFHNSVRYALTYNEFYDMKEIPVAKKHLQLGMDEQRASRRQASWITNTDRSSAAKSKIDDRCSMGWSCPRRTILDAHAVRLDFCHGATSAGTPFHPGR